MASVHPFLLIKHILNHIYQQRTLSEAGRYCIVYIVSSLPKVSPHLESKPPVYNIFLMEKSSIESPFSKVNPRAYYPDYTVMHLVVSVGQSEWSLPVWRISMCVYNQWA